MYGMPHCKTNPELNAKVRKCDTINNQQTITVYVIRWFLTITLLRLTDTT